jgi:hypothetical protein
MAAGPDVPAVVPASEQMSGHGADDGEDQTDGQADDVKHHGDSAGLIAAKY